MNPNEILSSTGETVEYAKQYVQKQIEYLRLEIAERIAKTTSSLITFGIVAFSIFDFCFISFHRIRILLGSNLKLACHRISDNCRFIFSDCSGTFFF